MGVAVMKVFIANLSVILFLTFLFAYFGAAIIAFINWDWCDPFTTAIGRFWIICCFIGSFFLIGSDPLKESDL